MGRCHLNIYGFNVMDLLSRFPLFTHSLSSAGRFFVAIRIAWDYVFCVRCVRPTHARDYALYIPWICTSVLYIHCFCWVGRENTTAPMSHTLWSCAYAHSLTHTHPTETQHTHTFADGAENGRRQTQTVWHSASSNQHIVLLTRHGNTFI